CRTASGGVRGPAPRPDHEMRPTGRQPTSTRGGAPTMSATVCLKVTTPHGPHIVTLSHTRAGLGEPLLLLHCIGHHRQAWDPVVDILATEREVIAVDLPGFGDSPALPGGLPHDLPPMNAALGALCAELEIGRPHVAVNSLCGRLAL